MWCVPAAAVAGGVPDDGLLLLQNAGASPCCRAVQVPTPPPPVPLPPAYPCPQGANFGWFTLLSAAAGCHVLAWEPVPYFAAFLKYGLLRSGLTQQVALRENIVSDAGGQLEMVVPQRGIWGTAGIGGANLDGTIDNEGAPCRGLVSITIRLSASQGQEHWATACARAVCEQRAVHRHA